MEAWSSRGARQACRRGSTELRSSKALEASCRRADVEYGDMEALWRSLDIQEVWSAAGALQIEVKRYGALEVRCRCSDGEVWRHRFLAARCRCGDIEALSYRALGDAL